MKRATTTWAVAAAELSPIPTSKPEHPKETMSRFSIFNAASGCAAPALLAAGGCGPGVQIDPAPQVQLAVALRLYFHYAEGVTGALGGDSIEMVRQHDVDDLRLALVLLGRHWHSMKKALELRSPRTPELRERGDDSFGRDWARGFMRGVSTTAESWDSLRRDPEARAWLQSLQLLGAEDVLLTSDKRLTAKQRMDLLADIPNQLLRLHRHFYSRRSAHFRKDVVGEDFERRSTKPCPCGSGMDYHKCCGSSLIQ